MASAQVLPSSRKQEHLEAGKRRLEEFRKKKAAERARKASASVQPQASDVGQDLTQPLETEHLWHTDSDGAGTSDRPNGTIDTFSVSINNKDSIIKNAEQGSLKDEDDNPPSIGDHNRASADLVYNQTNNHDLKRHDASKFLGAVAVNYGQETNEIENNSLVYTGSSQVGLPYQSLANHSVALHPQASQQFDSSSSQSSLYWTESLSSKENHTSLRDSAGFNLASHVATLPSNSAISQLQTEPRSVGMLSPDVDSQQPGVSLSRSIQVEQEMHGSTQFNGLMNSNFREGNFGSFLSVPASSVQANESRGFNFNSRSSSNHAPLYLATSEPNSRRSRPSFLDSLNVPRASSGGSFLRHELEESPVPNALKSNGLDLLGSSAFQKPSLDNETLGPFQKSQPPSALGAIDRSMDYLVSTHIGIDQPKSSVIEDNNERKHGFYSPKQNEDFAALEQHIEDLTQEKFSFQRALEASRALSESLAAENSSLTDSYNQQRSVVDQLKSDMGRLQEEIKAYLAELEAVRIELGNAQLECNAADERAKLLASEVIGLEEKALRLRSNELKLERELENSHTEITLYRKKISSLEKDRQDLQSTIDALQEEKKLLQSKLRKASASGKSMDVSGNSTNKKDISTSTEDLDAIPDTLTQEMHDTVSGGSPGFSALSENRGPDLEVSSVYIPPDQMTMIQNINALISELALEKEELMQAFTSESSQCSKLKALNEELSRKLEYQTQRLELLTAQTMANENIPTRLPDSHSLQESATYADEGDEVVERVLGWIMKLFPGGPSRRRTSKLL